MRKNTVLHGAVAGLIIAAVVSLPCGCVAPASQGRALHVGASPPDPYPAGVAPDYVPYAPRVGISPFTEKEGWNRTDLADLKLAQALTREVRKHLLEGAARPQMIPLGVLENLCRDVAAEQLEMTAAQRELIDKLDYAVSGAVESLSATATDVTLTVTYEVYRKLKTQGETGRLALVLKHTISPSAKQAAGKDALRACVGELVSLTAERIARHVCPVIVKHAHAAVRG